MPTYRDDAVVIRTHDLGEKDRIVTMLSRRHGRIRAVAKGVRRPGSRLGARLEPFMLVDVQCYIGRSLDTVQQVELLEPFGTDISADYARFTAAAAIAEVADRHADGEASLQQFLLLIGALRSLARGEHEAGLTLDSYLLRSLAIAGWAPTFGDCAVTGAPGPHSAFVISSGGVVADEVAPPGVPRLDPDTLRLLGSLLEGSWAVADASEPRARAKASGIVAAYTQFHLERGLRALPHVDRHSGAPTGRIA